MKNIIELSEAEVSRLCGCNCCNTLERHIVRWLLVQCLPRYVQPALMAVCLQTEKQSPNHKLENVKPITVEYKI